MSAPDREQVLRRRHRRERQAVVFGGLVAAMAVAGLGATAVYTGVIEAPYTRDFTTLASEGASTAPVPCPPEGATPTTYAEVQVQVLNGAGRAGLAGSVSEQLATRGFTVVDIGNFPGTYEGIAQVRFGEAGLRAAYTLAAQIEGAALALDARPDARVDLVLGTAFETLVDPAAVPLIPDAPLTPYPGCVPLNEALQQAPPGPAPETPEESPPPAEAHGRLPTPTA